MSRLNIIRLLPPELQNQIAAGEVVERPSSVVKELVENSLDAGATQIEVRLDQGGLAYIGVRDNGHGIAPDELEMAVTRHATSKLKSFADLLRIASLGFRGEALPSIASVSRLRLTSAHTPPITTGEGQNPQILKDLEVAEIAEAGQALEKEHKGERAQISQSTKIAQNISSAAFIAVEHGLIKATGPAALERGTFVEVHELFNNVPARLKFLKTQATELKRCQELLSRLALAWLNVGFSLNSGGKEILNFPPRQSLAQRLALLWPPELTNQLAPFDLNWENMQAHGLAGPPAVAQTRADRMLFYVNGRSVQDRMLLSAAREAYKGRLLGREYPQLVIFLSLPPEDVDVNVHPAKTEVRFVDESQVFRLVRRAVNQAVASFDVLAHYDAQSQNNSQTATQNIGQNIGQNVGQNVGQTITRPLGFWGAADRENIIPPQNNIGRGEQRELGEWRELGEQRELGERRELGELGEQREQRELRELGEWGSSEVSSAAFAGPFAGELPNELANELANELPAQSKQFAGQIAGQFAETPASNPAGNPAGSPASNPAGSSAGSSAGTTAKNVADPFSNPSAPSIYELAQINFTPRTPGPNSPSNFARPAYLMDSSPNLQASSPPAAELCAINSVSLDQTSNFIYPNFVYLGQIAQCYLLVKQEDALLLLDQHAVHEAILHSRLRSGSYQAETQLLGLPISLSLHPSEADELENLLPQLEALGYVLELKQNELPTKAHEPQTKTLEIKAIPAILDMGQAKEFLQKSLNGQANSLHDMWATMACRAAIKANCPLTNDEALELVRQWINTKDARYCPHGRPTGIRLGVNELEKMFKRKP